MDCQHYWRIEPCSGPTSQGHCKHCGAIRTFNNHLEWDSRWVDWHEPGDALMGDRLERANLTRVQGTLYGN